MGDIVADEMPVIASHPWLNFELDLASIPAEAWVALGECASKCEHLSNTPLRPVVAERLHQLYLAKGVHATTAIEGNTLTEEQVRQRLENRLHLPASQDYLGQEVDNIIEACAGIGQAAKDGTIKPLSPGLLCKYNGLVLRKLPLDKGIVPGVLRGQGDVRTNVGVSAYRAPNYDDVPGLVDRLCRWLGQWEPVGKRFGYIVSGILRAATAHLYIAWIHPFGDGNGRTARLVEFDILLRCGVPFPAAHLLSNHYNATRPEYYRRLDAASAEKSPGLFISYAIEGFRDGLREQLELVADQVRDVVWRSYVHETFRGVESATARRQRHVVLDISQLDRTVTRAEIPVLTARLREAYRRKTDRTVARDVAKLVQMQLLVDEGGRLSPNRALIDAFLPERSRS